MVGLDWVQLKNNIFLFIRHCLIYYILLNCNSKQTQSHIHLLKMAQYLT